VGNTVYFASSFSLIAKAYLKALHALVG